ncbi:MAG: protease pro-enzyme activation domain-containing protein [Ktedonobacterales bacterium]
MSATRRMTTTRRPAVLAALLPAVLFAVLAVGCAPSTSAPLARRQPARGATPTAPTQLGPTDPAQTISISVVLRGQAPGALDATLAAVSDPRSPSYHHYLSPAEYAQQFGSGAAARTTVRDVLRTAGFDVTGTTPNGLLVNARGTVGEAEALFGVQLWDYRDSHGTRFYRAGSPARLPARLAPIASGVLGLDTRASLHRGTLPGRPRASSSFAGYTPADLHQLYDLGAATQSSGGSGLTIALAEIDSFSQSDVDQYDQQFGISAPPVTVVSVNGAAPNPGPESVMDIEVLHAIAPKATLIAYESGDALNDTATMFAQIVGERRAQIISISLGVCEIGIDPSLRDAFVSSIESTFQQADAEGMSVLVASGDSGAYGCQDDNLSVQAPASSPYVTAVGGTALFARGDGSYGYEAGWEAPLEGAGGGGGLSVLFPQASWQAGQGVQNQYSNSMRQVPDVSADSDVLTGYAIYDTSIGQCSGNQCWQIYAGTSAATPLWAGLIALADQQRAAQQKPLLGFLNPALYQLGSAGATASPFHDVQIGGNLYYPATPGWDYASGLGSPDAAKLIASLTAL